MNSVYTAMKKYMKLALSVKKHKKWSPKCTKAQRDQTTLLSDYVMVRVSCEVLFYVIG